MADVVRCQVCGTFVEVPKPNRVREDAQVLARQILGDETMLLMVDSEGCPPMYDAEVVAAAKRILGFDKREDPDQAMDT